jgi:methionyl-tRNA formyltransferase
MRLVFAGTPAFARAALKALLDAGHEVALVLTQPDRPAGRGLNLRPSEVKTFAVERGLPLAQPLTLKSAEALEILAAAQAQVLVVAAYGLILPATVLASFPGRCINIHASLLPRWRGAAPIQRAILAGDRDTGISIMQMDAGLDTGPVFLQERMSIAPTDTAGSLHDKLAALGGSCIVRVLHALQAGDLDCKPQSPDGVTYAHKLGKVEATIVWTRNAVDIERQVRALNPFPVAHTTLYGELLRIWHAQAVDSPGGIPGQVIDTAAGGILVGCGSGALLVEELQRPGGKRLSVADFLRGVPLSAGELLGK